MNPTTRPPLRRLHGVDGFILPLTLWMIAIAGLVAAIVNVWVSNTVANARALAQRAHMDLVQSDIRNELVYLLARHPVSFRGLEIGPTAAKVVSNDFIGLMSGAEDSGRSLKLDGRPYVVAGNEDIVVRMQDASGLLNLNTIAPQNLRGLLAGYDVPAPQINLLSDTLHDYIDDDDLTRLAGAEKAQYERLNLPPPANALLTTPYEVQRVLGWDKLEALWKDDIANPILTTCRTGVINLNTAPGPVLMAAVPGLNQEKVSQVLARRSEKPFRSAREFGAVAGILMSDAPFLYGFTPGTCVLVDVIQKDSGQHTRFSLTLDRLSQIRPWRIDYAIRIPSEDSATLAQLETEDVFPTPESIDLQPEHAVSGTREQ